MATPHACDFCGDPADRIAWYGDDGSRFGGGQLPIFLCGACTAPCNHYADQHAGYDREEALAVGSDGLCNCSECIRWSE